MPDQFIVGIDVGSSKLCSAIAIRETSGTIRYVGHGSAPSSGYRGGEVTDVETIATGRGIRDLPRLRRLYGKGYWRKMKGSARIRLHNGRIRLAELHWYEAHGIGKKEDAAGKEVRWRNIRIKELK